MVTTRRARISTALLLVGLLLASPALADIIKFKDGRVVEGQIMEETRTKVTVKLQFGTQIFKRSEIASITRQKTEGQEYDERFKNLRKDDVEGHYQLGVWAKNKGMKTKAKRLFEKTIRMSPDHAGARAELGQKAVDGKWLPAEEADKILAEREEEALIAKGYVKQGGVWRSPEDMEKIRMGLVEYEGAWITPEEEALRKKGLVKFRNRWMTEDERTMRMRGFDRYQGKWVNKTELLNMSREWVDAWEAITPHYKIRTNINEDFCDDVANMMEQAYLQYLRVLGVEPKGQGGKKPKPRQRMLINIFATREEYNDWCRTNRMADNADLDGFYNARRNLVATWSGNNLDFIRRFIVSLGVWQYYYNSVGNGLPSWLSEGLAAYFNACYWDGSTLQVGVPDGLLIKFLFQLQKKKRLFEANVFVAEDLHEVIERGDFKRFSAQGYAWTYYLLKGPDESRRAKFFTFLDEVKRAPFVLGNTDILAADMLREAFGGRPQLEDFHDEVLEYLSNLNLEKAKTFRRRHPDKE